MKSVLVLSFVLIALSVECARHKAHKTVMKSSGFEDTEWPQPEVIRDFEVPPEFTASPIGASDDNDDTFTTPSSGRHHGKSHKSHSN